METTRRAKRPADTPLQQMPTKRAALETPASRLESLPEELLEDIIARSLNDSADLECSISCLIRVSRRFRRLAEPHRYRSFVYTFNARGSLPLLLRTLLQRPDLAANMRSIDLRDVHCSVVRSNGDLSSTDKQEMQKLFDTVLPELEVEDRADFLCNLMQLKEEELMTLLLWLVPNLQSLEIIPSWIPTQEHSFMQLLHATKSPFSRSPPLSQLRCLTLSRGKEQHFYFYRLNPFLNVPSLRTVYVKRPFYCSIVDKLPEPNSSSIDTAVFRHFDINPVDVQVLAFTCKSLKTLAFECLQYEACYDAPMVPKLREALLSLRDSLERLVLDITDESVWVRFDPHRTKYDVLCMDSLKSLHRLKALSVSAQLLTGRCLCSPVDAAHVAQPAALEDWLPASLEVLTINSDLDEHNLYHKDVFYDFMAHLARAGRAAVPNLRLIELYAGAPVQFLDPLKPVFKSWGVDVVETFLVEAFDYY